MKKKTKERSGVDRSGGVEWSGVDRIEEEQARTPQRIQLTVTRGREKKRKDGFLQFDKYFLISC